MKTRRPHHPALRGLVEVLWASDEGEPRPGARERVLPTGTLHLVLRLEERPLRLLQSEDDVAGITVGTAVVGGPRAACYLRDVSTSVPTVGAQVRPGAAGVLLGAPAGALAGRHTPLEALWGSRAGRMREQLAACRTLEARLDRMEALLVEGLHPTLRPSPGILRALTRLEVGPCTVRALVEESGYSHRHFIARFHEGVGLAPKCFARVLRLQRTLQLLGRAPRMSLVELALEAGYSDQPHLTREFRALTGLSPARYRLLASPGSNHVPLVNFLQDGTAVGAQDGSHVLQPGSDP